MKHRQPMTLEPNVAIACQWWMDLPDIWMPIGWKDHLFRFNVFWSGMIYAMPNYINRRTEAWKGQGAQFAFIPRIPGDIPKDYQLPVSVLHDDRSVSQGWSDGAAPVLWTQWLNEGVVLRQEVFAHVPGAKAVETGIEPLFAWVRLSIFDTISALPLEKEHGFLVQINAPVFRPSMAYLGHTWDWANAAYPRQLSAKPSAGSLAGGLRIVEKEGIRLAVAPAKRCRALFDPAKGMGGSPLLQLYMPAEKGMHIDLLIPMLPTEPKIMDEELTIGFDGARQQADRFWRITPSTAAHIKTLETDIDETIKHNLKFAEVIAEKNPADGQYAFLTGSLAYANVWATPYSFVCIWLLDMLGYHDVVARHLEIFRKEQGTVVPPGEFFTLHPGYLSSPKSLTSVDWLSDHGALLYAIAMHALLSGDRSFIARWMDTIVKACEFIRYARAIDNHGGVKGVMPPAVATDMGTRTQAIWNDGWNYKGLYAAVRLLRRSEHPRAAEFAVEAEDYRRTFLKAFRAKAATMPTWTDVRGRRHLFAPTALSGDAPFETRAAIYLDTGPLFLVFAGLMDARDPLMRSILLWFRQGPLIPYVRHDANTGYNPFLDYEMSSFEPLVSWNIFHSHQLGDRRKFLEGMYSLFAGNLSRKTRIACESRGGMSGIPATLPIYLARLAVVDDHIREGELHLLRLMPLAWLKPGAESVFERMPTEFGPVTLKTKVSRDGRTLDVTFKPEFRPAQAPHRIILHSPPIPGLKRIKMNGKTVSAGRRTHSCRMKAIG